jgi:hypothetical protein
MPSIMCSRLPMRRALMPPSAARSGPPRTFAWRSRARAEGALADMIGDGSNQRCGVEVEMNATSAAAVWTWHTVADDVAHVRVRPMHPPYRTLFAAPCISDPRLESHLPHLIAINAHQAVVARIDSDTDHD